MAKKKTTAITMEMFDEAILPRIEEIFEEKLKKYRIEVLEFKEEVLGEIKNLRDEVVVTLHQYERTDQRIGKIDRHLGISTEI